MRDTKLVGLLLSCFSTTEALRLQPAAASTRRSFAQSSFAFASLAGLPLAAAAEADPIAELKEQIRALKEAKEQQAAAAVAPVPTPDPAAELKEQIRALKEAKEQQAAAAVAPVPTPDPAAELKEQIRALKEAKEQQAAAAVAPVPAPAAPAPETSTPLPTDATEMSYDKLKKLLIDCKDPDLCIVQKVAFQSASGEQADVILKSGERLTVIGIPEENPSNDSSPAKLVAKLRDAKVPFTFPFQEALAKARSNR